MSSTRWSPIAWVLWLMLCCAGGPAVAQSAPRPFDYAQGPLRLGTADSLVVRYVPSAEAYLVPRALVADYVACGTEAEVLRAVEAEAAQVIAVQDSLVRVLQERSEAVHAEASACSRALDLSAGRVRALGVEVEQWRGAARSAERRARRWRMATVSAGLALLGVVWVALR